MADEGAVYRRIEEIKATMWKVFRTKKLFLDAADQLADLASGLDESEPYEGALVGLIRYNEASYYGLAEEPLRQIQCLIKAGRLFARAGAFHFVVARIIRDAWTEPISDSIHCYRQAVILLRNSGKPILAFHVMRELAREQFRLELWDYAARTLDEAINFAVERKLGSTMVVDAGIQAVRCSARCEEADRALKIVEKLLPLSEQDTTRVRLQILAAQLHLWRQDWSGLEEALKPLPQEARAAILRVAAPVKDGVAALAERALYDVRRTRGLDDVHVEVFQRILTGLRRIVAGALEGLIVVSATVRGRMLVSFAVELRP
jgi:tetratricopeptide (TPR) repeat protein